MSTSGKGHALRRVLVREEGGSEGGGEEVREADKNSGVQMSGRGRGVSERGTSRGEIQFREGAKVG